MASVYLAHDNNLDTTVAIKIPDARLLKTPGFRERFTQEIRSMVSLRHPNILKIIDVGLEGKTPFAVMHYLGGGSVNDRRYQAKDGSFIPVLPVFFEKWLSRIAEAIDFIHRKGFVHRDIKPDNILFDEDGNAFLSDFGIVKVLAETNEAAQAGLTQTGMLVGTPEYLAPEISLGQDFDGRSDQYSLAVMIYELLMGHRPFLGSTAAAIVINQTNHRLHRIDKLSQRWGEHVVQILRRALASDPTARFSSCAEFSETLIAACEQQCGRHIDEPVVSKCPQCDAVIRIQPEWIGRIASCNKCSARMQIQPTGLFVSASNTLPQPQQPETVSGLKQPICPRCKSQLKIPQQLNGQKVKCTECQTILQTSLDGKNCSLAPTVETGISHPLDMPSRLPQPNNVLPFRQVKPMQHKQIAKKPSNYWRWPLILLTGGLASTAVLLLITLRYLPSTDNAISVSTNHSNPILSSPDSGPPVAAHIERIPEQSSNNQTNTSIPTNAARDIALDAIDFSKQIEGSSEPDDEESVLNAESVASDNLVPKVVTYETATRLYVAQHPVPGKRDGLSWETAFEDFQDAIDVLKSTPGSIDEVWIAKGQYSPFSFGRTRDAEFELVGGVNYFGGFNGDETEIGQRPGLGEISAIASSQASYLCGVLSKNHPGFELELTLPPKPGRKTALALDASEKSNRVIRVVKQDKPILLDRFTIAAGSNMEIGDSAQTGKHCGAGVFISSSVVKLHDCRIVSCSAKGPGAGVYVYDSDVHFEGVSWFANKSDAIGSHLSVHQPNHRIIILRSCELSFGFGIAFSQNGGVARISNVHFAGTPTGTQDNQAINLTQANATIENCIVDWFSARTSQDSALVANGSHVAVTNCTFAANGGSPSSQGGDESQILDINATNKSRVQVHNTIAASRSFTMNPDPRRCVSADSTSRLDIAYSCVRSGFKGPTVINLADPLFSDVASDISWELASNSPCIDKGSSALLPRDLLDLDHDGKKDERIPMDIYFRRRIFGASVDMGAVELQVAPSRSIKTAKLSKQSMSQSLGRLVDPRARARLVAEHQIQGDLTEAIAVLREASELAKGDILMQFQLALLEVYAHDREGFEKHCAFMLEHIAANEDDSDRCLIVLALTLREDTTDEWNQAVAWAEMALAADPARHWKHRALAAALMRAGRTEEALESLTSDDRQLDVLGEQMRAILLARLGRISEAKQSEEMVRQLTNASHSPRPQKPFGDLTDDAWWDWYEYEIRESELESLLRNSPTESSAN